MEKSDIASIHKAFFNLKNVLYVKKDSRGNIIYPNDKKSLELYKEIIESGINQNNQYYNKITKKWYQKYTEEIVIETGEKINIEFFEDITDIKEEIYSLKIDALTKLLKDRNESDKLILEYMDYAIRKREKFSIIMADIDEFKTINDTFGHACGDMVLREVGKILIDNTRQSHDKFDYRPSDILTRVGGDEFLILLKNCSKEQTKDRVELIEKKINSLDLKYFNDYVPVQMSFGYCNLKVHDTEEINLKKLKDGMSKIADEFLYIEKNRKKIEENQIMRKLLMLKKD